jgi:hypothetical protein
MCYWPEYSYDGKRLLWLDGPTSRTPGRPFANDELENWANVLARLSLLKGHDSHEKILIPVGTAIIIVAAVK